jgi:hypothetical protein
MRVRKWLRNGFLAALAAVAATTLFAWWASPNYFDLLVLRPDVWKIPPAEEIAVADALADLEVLERILRTGYIGYDYFQTRGTDWDALFADAAAALAAHTDPVHFCDFAATINDLFRSVDDRHLNVWNPRGCRFPPRRPMPLASDLWFRLDGDSPTIIDPGSAAVSVGSRLLECADRDVAKDLHYAARKVDGQWEFGHRIIYLSDKSREKIACRFRTPDGKLATAKVAMRDMRNQANDPPPDASAVEPGETTYIRLTTFAPENESDMSPFLNSVASAASARAIVVDLRGNSGGSDRYFYDWSRNLLHGVKRIGAGARLTSETTWQSEINMATEEWAVLQDTAKMRAWYSVRAVEVFAMLTAAGAVNRGATWRRMEHHPRFLRGRAEGPFTGKMLVVADRACASACEGAVMVARGAFDALLVGTNTRGVHAFIEPLPFRLPNSGLVLRAARKMLDPSVLEGNEFRENRGYLPDVWIDLSDDGAAAREMGPCLADPACADQILPGITSADERHRDLSYY